MSKRFEVYPTNTRSGGRLPSGTHEFRSLHMAESHQALMNDLTDQTEVIYVLGIIPSKARRRPHPGNVLMGWAMSLYALSLVFGISVGTVIGMDTPFNNWQNSVMVALLSAAFTLIIASAYVRFHKETR
jgi:hypothetical protein